MALLIDFLFLAVIVGIVLLYTKRGFFKSLVRLVKSILVFVLAYAFGSTVARLLADRWIAAPVRESVYQKLLQMYQSSTEGFDAERILSALPSFARNAATEEQIRSLDVSGEALVNAAADTVAGPITTVISNVLGYALVFVLSFVVLSVLAWLLDRLIDKIGVLNVANRLLGALLGIVFAFLLSVAAASFIRFFWADSTAVASSVAIQMLCHERVLSLFSFLDLGELFAELLG